MLPGKGVFVPVKISNSVLGTWNTEGFCFASLSIKGVLQMLLGCSQAILAFVLGMLAHHVLGKQSDPL